MTESDWTRIKALFGATFEATPDERRRLLQEEPDTEVRERVLALLSAHDSEQGPLDRPAVAAIAGIDTAAITPPLTLVGRKLGPYRVLREVGHGGMGVVYEAMRADEEFDQRVAVKSLRIGADGETLRRRFRQERQILAALQHPNIAHLHDGAVTEDGLPYIVLEYVDGLPIDAHCAALTLDVRARLDLFRQVVAAVQYAHGQLVIHRDLKPTNVLVTPNGVVKLVDFGIAKLLQGESPEITTEVHKPLTIAYASPEQVRGEPITIASDVYSLGVVLYRLLTGRVPLGLDTLSLDRAVTALCNDTPALPSQYLEPESAAALGLGGVERLRRTLRGELDAIVMMALRKEPERRYATAQALGDDIQRYLRGLPIAAAPDTASYRLRKFVRRQRALVAGVGIGATAIVLGAGTALWQARVARLEARRAAAVSRFLQGIIGAGDVSASSTGARLGPSATVAELLDSAARRLPLEFAGDPRSRSEVHIALGRAFVTQQRWRDAETQFRAARELMVSRFGERRPEVAQALQGLAEIAVLHGSPNADSLARHALAIYDALGDTTSAEYARALGILATTPALAGDYRTAESLLVRAMHIHERLGLHGAAERASVLAALTAVRESMGRNWPDSRADYERALAILDSLPGSEVAEKATVLWYVVRAEAAQGHLNRADSLALEALRVAERATGPNNPAVALQLVQLAQVSRERGDLAAGRPYIARALGILKAQPDIHPLTRERVQMEAARYHWADHDFAAAESLAQIAYLSRVAVGNPLYVAEAGQLYGSIQRDAHEFAAAETVLLDAYRRTIGVVGNQAGFAVFTAGSIARLYYMWNRPADAEPYLATMPDSVQRALRTTLSRQVSR